MQSGRITISKNKTDLTEQTGQKETDECNYTNEFTYKD